MPDNAYEFTGKTVDEAVAEGLSQLNVVRSDVAVEVLSKGSRGIFGIGSEPARVRITLETADRQVDGGAPAGPSSADGRVDVAGAEEAEVAQVVEESETAVETGDLDEPASDRGTVQPVVAEGSKGSGVATVGGHQDGSIGDDEAAPASLMSDDELAGVAAEMLGEIVRLMGFEADVAATWQDPDENGGSPFLRLDIEGEDLGGLIGRRGETLASLQYLIRLMVNQRIKEWRNIVVDVERYKERRETQLTQLALRMADQVTDSGRAMALEPMPANERRIVHIALRDHPSVYTQSSGEGDHRKVNIVPRDTA